MPKIISLKKEFNDALRISVSILNQGGLIVFPTDTVYGLGGKYDNPEAIQKIYEVKGREQTKALAVLIGELSQIPLVAEFVSNLGMKLTNHFWPGGLTVVVQKNSKITTALSKDNSIGIRIPNDAFVRQLCREVGPLANTSANLSGFPNTTNVYEVIDQLGDRVDLVIDNGECKGGIPSTVIDCRDDQLKILREGIISRKQVESFLKNDAIYP